MVPPGAAGMARGVRAGRGPQSPTCRVGRCSHGGCLLTVTLSPAQGQDHSAEASGLGPSTHPAPEYLRGVSSGSGVGVQRERDILGTCLLLGCLIPTPSPRLRLSGQSCPATSRGICAAGTRISPATSDGSAARGKGRAPTTPLAQVKGWLPSQGPWAAQGTLQPPVPMAGMCPEHSRQPHACGASSARAAQAHLDPGLGCGCCGRSWEHPCPRPLHPGCP